MILAHPRLDTVFDFTGPEVPSLVVEEPRFFRALLLDIYNQQNGDEGDLVLSEKGTTLPISAWVELIDKCLSFDLNRKSLLNKITAALEQTALSETFFLKTEDILRRLEDYADELAFELDCDIVCERCGVTALLKALGLRLRDSYDEPLERLLDYMELIRTFDRDKLFILVNLRSFFTDSELSLFLSSIAQHEYRVLLLDNAAGERLPLEKRVIIDNDLCEI